jgi:hypothetical protein
LHRNATGYAPLFQTAFGPMITGQWIDYIYRCKWSSAADGKVQCWFKVADGQPMDSGDLVKDYTGPTWNIPNVAVYQITCVYRGITSQAGTVYHDSVKVGTTFEVVDPGRY